MSDSPSSPLEVPRVWERRALGSAVRATLVVAVLAGAGATIRTLPLFWGAQADARVAMPFARSLLIVALEIAILVGWPAGWAFAAHGLVERGEARVYAALGEGPRALARRLWPQAAAFAGALAIISLLGGRDAAAPGRVVNELIANGRVACLASGGPNAVPVPFVSASWLCGPGFPPRLVGKAPVGGVVYLAHRVELSGDLRTLELEDAHFTVKNVELSVGQLTLRGLPAYLRASSVPASFRALALVLGALVSALTSVLFTFRRAPRHSLIAVAVGASGPLAALGMLRLLEQLPRGPAFALFLLVPAAAGAATALAGVILSRLRWSRRAGTS